jgi:DNA polymerase III delta prime subunit
MKLVKEMNSLVQEVFGDLTCYYSRAFYGRDAGKEERTLRNGETKTSSWGPAPGITQWVADNFEVLGFKQKAPFEDRLVNEGNRAKWSPFVNDYLNRLFDGNPTRKYVLRRSMEFKERKQWALFPDPHEARRLNLTGAKGEVPLAVVSINVNPKDATDQRLMFDTVQFSVIIKLDTNDVHFSAGITAEDRDDYEVWDLESVPVELPAVMRSMKSTKKQVDDRMRDWKEYLNVMYEANRSNEWGAQILDITPPSPDNPEYVFKLKCKQHAFNQINSRRNTNGRLHGISNEHSDDHEVWKRKEDSQNKNSTKRDSKEAGRYLKVIGKPKNGKGGFVEFNLRVKPPVAENPMIGLDEEYIGMFLINDVSLDLIQIDRQRKGLERLLELEANNNVHEWLFNIQKAEKNPRNLPEMEHEPLSQMNEEQELAVRGALAAKDVFLIQGPPGTGKTTVIAEIINQATESGERVLLASQSNLAVDNALGRFANTPNIRPIRRYAHSAEVDPDAEKFLESNVIKDFFVPSIRQHCEREQADSDSLLASKQSIEMANHGLPMMLGEATAEEKLMAQLHNQNEELKDRLEINQSKLLNLSNQRDALSKLVRFLEPDQITNIDEGLANAAGIEYKPIQEHITILEEKRQSELAGQMLDHLKSPPHFQAESPEILALEAQKDQAVADEDYDRAKVLKTQLDELRASSTGSGEFWSQWTKVLHRLNSRLAFPYSRVEALCMMLEPPANLAHLVEDIVYFGYEPEGASMTLEDIKTKVEAMLENVESIQATIQIEFDNFNDAIQDNRASEERAQRKRSDALVQCQSLLDNLPNEVSDNASLTEGLDLAALTKRGEQWLAQNNAAIEADAVWRTIRADWLKDLQEPEPSTLRDLETMYTQMVNDEGVTTSFSGKYAWYSQHTKAPIDIVIIDEISKATPPEILLPLLLGKKAILVGDHRQLPPTFKDPTSKSLEEMQADELEDKRFARGGKFEKMVTSALFAEYFKEADDSLKVTLLKQYRMHKQIMQCTNEFYEGQLKCGLGEVEERRMKQHGFHITKKDSFGSFLGEGSDLLRPEQHVVWVDSSFNRDGKYCQETRPETTTSRRNVREVQLAKYMLNEFEHQIAAKKALLDPSAWASDSMLRHLDYEQRLPVGFITFYADQKRAFREIANEGDSWAAMRNRWPNLSVRADTVDKFQGGERPVVFVSMVTSPQVPDGEIEAFEAKVANYSHNAAKVAKRNGFKNGGIPVTKTSFVRSPERINVAFSRAQNLLVILGNRFTLEKVDNVRIERDDGSISKKSMYKNIQRTIGIGGMIDGRDML